MRRFTQLFLVLALALGLCAPVLAQSQTGTVEGKVVDPQGAVLPGATVTLTCQATPSWTDPCDALPLDKFQVTVTIPSGTAFNSLKLSTLAQLTSVNQLTSTVSWQSLNNSEVVVSTSLPY